MREALKSNILELLPELKKALEYRKRLKELEQELENIKKSEKDKIAGIIGNDEQQLS